MVHSIYAHFGYIIVQGNAPTQTNTSLKLNTTQSARYRDLAAITAVLTSTVRKHRQKALQKVKLLYPASARIGSLT